MIQDINNFMRHLRLYDWLIFAHSLVKSHEFIGSEKNISAWMTGPHSYLGLANTRRFEFITLPYINTSYMDIWTIDGS